MYYLCNFSVNLKQFRNKAHTYDLKLLKWLSLDVQALKNQQL